MINPAKSEVGIISLAILDGIVLAERIATSVNLFDNTSLVIDGFKGIRWKKNCTTASLEVVDFYPSITETLLKRALTIALEFVEITDDEEDIIMHTRKSLLF